MTAPLNQMGVDLLFLVNAMRNVELYFKGLSLETLLTFRQQETIVGREEGRGSHWCAVASSAA